MSSSYKDSSLKVFSLNSNEALAEKKSQLKSAQN